MDDPGYASYQDPRLVPPDINAPDETYECTECVHYEACAMWVENHDVGFDAEGMTACELWQEV